MSACGQCGLDKPPEKFRLRRKADGTAYRGKVCQSCHQAKGTEWRRANPDRVRRYNANAKANNPRYHADKALANHFKRKFGLTMEQRAAMITAQGNRCAICNTDTPTRRGWCVDHDHATGKLRKILCAPCNSMLGLAKDDVKILARAAAYLEEHRS